MPPGRFRADANGFCTESRDGWPLAGPMSAIPSVPCGRILASAPFQNGVVRSVSWSAGRCFAIQLSKINLAHSSASFQVRKHTFKASVACNGREVLRWAPRGRHGISAREAADCLGNREPTIHWKVSRTSAACRVGSRKHLSPSAMRSEPVGRIPGDEVTLRLAGITCPLINSRQNRGCVQ